MVDFDAIDRFRNRALNPESPYTKGTAQNPDIYFQAVEASNPFYNDIVGITEDYLKTVFEKTGREYNLFDYYGADDAEHMIIAMGSVCETIEETVDYINRRGGKVGLLKVRLFRPFSTKHFLAAIPETVKRIAVLDRTKEKGAVGEPLYVDVKASFFEEEVRPQIVGGIYGLGSKDTTPSQIYAVYKNLAADEPKNDFTIGITDDVTHKSLPVDEYIDTEDEDTIRCLFWGYGSDGTVGANQQAIQIIGEGTDMFAQAYFDYDSKKSGGVTMSHLRFGTCPIRSTYLISTADFVSCSRQAYVYQYDLLKQIKDGGTFLFNTIWSEEELEEFLPASFKRELAEKNINFYIINASEIAESVGLDSRINMVMQAAFFKLTEVIPVDKAVNDLKQTIEATYGRYGKEVVKMNHKAVDMGIDKIVKVEIPSHWKDAVDEADEMVERPDFVANVADVMNKKEGNSLPVSTFVGREDGVFPAGTSAYEKRGIALTCPEWISENCIQCNQCALVCPHAVIRPFLLTDEEKAKAPANYETLPAIGRDAEGLEFRLQISPLDCTGCGNCAEVCPSRNKALVMKDFEEQLEKEQGNWDFSIKEVGYKEDVFPANSIKGSQFKQPLLEFSGACAGCGETPYAKLVTQLYGDRMIIANATGCTSIWGASAPSTVYCTNKQGQGPAWANSLFEDNAEYGYGMALANKKIREKIALLMEEYIEIGSNDEIKEAFKGWLEAKDVADDSKVASARVLSLLDTVELKSDVESSILDGIIKRKDYLIKRSIWIFGGDGWAYDIGYGGLDHVLASGEDINILVYDTEVYSNTGGQSSKATPLGAVAQFAAAGKRVRKKDLGLMAMSYGYVYVAQIAMGANMNQTVRAIREAESYDGPSLVMAYSPCISHGIRGGMGLAMNQMKRAVASGYWTLYRNDPRLEDEGKNPFVLDSKEPTESFREFLESENRYRTLERNFPEDAEILFAAAEKDAKSRYEKYRRMAEEIPMEEAGE